MRTVVFGLAIAQAAILTVLVVLAILPFAGYTAAGAADPGRFGYFFGLGIFAFGLPAIVALMVEKLRERMGLALGLQLALPVLAWALLGWAMGRF